MVKSCVNLSVSMCALHSRTKTFFSVSYCLQWQVVLNEKNRIKKWSVLKSLSVQFMSTTQPKSDTDMKSKFHLHDIFFLHLDVYLNDKIYKILHHLCVAGLVVWTRYLFILIHVIKYHNPFQYIVTCILFLDLAYFIFYMSYCSYEGLTQ